MATEIVKNKSAQNQPSIFLNRNYPFLGLGVFTVILAVSYFFLIAPKLSQVKQQQNSQLPIVQEELKVLDDYFNKSNTLSDFIKNYNAAHQADIDKINYILPSEAKIPELIAQLEALVTSDGFKISSLDIGSKEIKKESRDDADAQAITDSGLAMLSIGLGINGGDYFALKRFLQDIENHLRLMDVMSISFQSTEGAGEYLLNIQTYYLP